MLLRMIKRVKSWLRRPKRYWQLFLLLKKIKPLRIMEIGTWTGDRALTMITLAKKYHSAKDISYYGFDLFGGMNSEIFQAEKSKWPPTQQEANRKLLSTGANIHLFQGDTMKVLPEISQTLPKMDLIFIDGGHSLETISSDWKWASKLMHDKTEVVFDDYWLGRNDAGCKLVVDGISLGEYRVDVWPIVDKFKKTSFGPLKIKLARVKKLGQR
jgi:hypothetical protein